MTHLSRTLVAPSALLDLDDWIGQRKGTFRFDLIDGVTGENIGQINPVRSATLSHDTSATIKRSLQLPLGVSDVAAINSLTDRVQPFMVFPDGSEYPLGRYMFVDLTTAETTNGSQANAYLSDEMFLVDQAIQAGINGNGTNATDLIIEVMAGLPVQMDIEPSQFASGQSWPAGTYRGQILSDIANTCGYFTPWFDNYGFFRMVRAFEPTTSARDRLGRLHDSSGKFVSTSAGTVAPPISDRRVATVDLDKGNRVLRDSIVSSTDILTRPNRFIVVSNTASNPNIPVVGIADVPVSAPNSISNRGFTITSVTDLQVLDSVQAAAAARNQAIQQTILEKVTLSTAPDPRHDSYDVVAWQENLWVELSWSMELIEGGVMRHVLRKSYS